MKTIEKCLSLALVVFGCINYNMAQSGITASTRQKEKKITIHPNPVVKVLNVLGGKGHRNSLYHSIRYLSQYSVATRMEGQK